MRIITALVCVIELTLTCDKETNRPFILAFLIIIDGSELSFRNIASVPPKGEVQIVIDYGAEFILEVFASTWRISIKVQIEVNTKIREALCAQRELNPVQIIPLHHWLR